MNLKFKEELFSKIMQKSKLQIHNSSFENDVMRRIEKEAKFRKSLLNNVKLSGFFLFLGGGLGLFVSVSLPLYQYTNEGISLVDFVFFFQVLYILAIVSQIHNILKIIEKLNNSVIYTSQLSKNYNKV